MKIKIGENLPVEAAELLGRHGHDALMAIEQNLGGRSDFEVAAVLRKEGRLLITLDLDFSDVRLYPPEDFPGIIVLRLGRQDKTHVLEVLRRVVVHMTAETPRAIFGSSKSTRSESGCRRGPVHPGLQNFKLTSSPGDRTPSARGTHSDPGGQTDQRGASAPVSFQAPPCLRSGCARALHSRSHCEYARISFECSRFGA
jgi:predicted nuclease of predicted toxin-antitoxin system